MEEKKLEKLLRCLVTRAYFFIHFLSIPKKEEIWLRHHWNCFFLNWKESTHPSFADDEKCVTSRSLPDDVVALIVETLFKEEISFDKSKMNGGNMEERNQTTTSDHHPSSTKIQTHTRSFPWGGGGNAVFNQKKYQTKFLSLFLTSD